MHCIPSWVTDTPGDAAAAAAVPLEADAAGSAGWSATAAATSAGRNTAGSGVVKRKQHAATITTTSSAPAPVDCGECKACLDKRKFGGPHRLKRRCERLAEPSGRGGGTASYADSTAAEHSLGEYEVDVPDGVAPGQLILVRLPGGGPHVSFSVPRELPSSRTVRITLDGRTHERWDSDGFWAGETALLPRVADDCMELACS